jgi:hypothetical protein
MTVADRLTVAGPGDLVARLRLLAKPRLEWLVGVRWVFILLVTGLAFRGTLSSVVREISQGGGLVQICCPVFSAFVAVSAARRRGRRMLPIHDRETDVIVGISALALAVSAASLLAPRLAAVYYLWRLDLLFVWLFLFGSAVLMFGLRPTTHYRAAWLVLVMIWPFPIRFLTLSIVNDLRVVAGFHLLAALAVIAYGTRADDRWRPIPTLVAAMAGVACVIYLVPAVKPVYLVLLPTVVALFVGVLLRRLIARPAPYRAPHGNLVVGTTPRVAIGLAVGAVIASLVIPGPPTLTAPSVPVVHRTAYATAQFVPSGWRVLEAGDEAFTRRYFGSASTWTRIKLLATGTTAIDSQGLDRRLVIDVLTVPRKSTLDTFPVTTTYPMGDLRLGPEATVDLGAGVIGHTYSAVDQDRQLTWTMLTFTWTVPAAVARPPRPTDPVGPDATLTQRVTLMAVDDHRADAPFPQPAAAIGNSIRAVLSRIVRGDQSQLAAANTAKDSDLLAVAARGVVGNVTGDIR